MRNAARNSVNTLLSKGIVEKNFRDKRRTKEKTVRVVFFCGEEEISYYIEKLEKTAPKQAAVLKALENMGELSIPDIISYANTTRNSVEALYVKKLVDYREVRVLRNPLESKEQGQAKELCLSELQNSVANTIKSADGGTFLLHGVTGSGKTEVYMSIVEKVLAQGSIANG